jgi:hypothetical protein
MPQLIEIERENAKSKPLKTKNPARMLGFLKSLTAKCSAVRVQSYKEIELETFCFDAS